MLKLPADSSLAHLLAQFPRAGILHWIGVRPSRSVPMLAVDMVEARVGGGLAGDRYKGGSGKRDVTLVQAEHLSAIAALAGRADIAPALLRRNLLVSGIPLLALKGTRFMIGDVLLEGTGPCDPCSRMEVVLGPGGYNAMRGMGGLTARILGSGTMRIGQTVVAQ
jgi:MOSC domain-containing protein YiiM